MDLGFLAKRAEKLVASNSPAILSAIGATGVVVTALLVGKATFRSAKIIAAEETAELLVEEPGLISDPTDKEKDAETARQLEYNGMSVVEIAVEMNRPEKTILALLKLAENAETAATHRVFVLDKRQRAKLRFKLVWKEYVPAVIVGAITITAIFGANHISTRRAAALASAFTISQTFAEEYQDKVLSKIGKTKEGQIRDEIAQDKADRNPISKEQENLLLAQPGIELWMDGYSGRFFRSDMETVRGCVNDFNEMIFKAGSGSLSDFWEMLNPAVLTRTDESDDIGWTSERILRADYRFVRTRLGPTAVITFIATPFRDFHKFG